MMARRSHVLVVSSAIGMARNITDGGHTWNDLLEKILHNIRCIIKDTNYQNYSQIVGK